MNPITFFTGYVAGLATIILFWIVGYILSPWARAFTSGAAVSVATIVGMRLRRTPAHLLIDAYVRLVKKDLKPRMEELELLYITNREKVHTAADLVDLAMYGEQAGATRQGRF
ncbi:MAG: flotillin-like FloA family protein [Phycisphaerales bacterium]